MKLYSLWYCISVFAITMDLIVFTVAMVMWAKLATRELGWPRERQKSLVHPSNYKFYVKNNEIDIYRWSVEELAYVAYIRENNHMGYDKWLKKKPKRYLKHLIRKHI